MNESPETVAAAEPAPQDAGSFLGNLFNLFFEPSATFARIFQKPRVWLVILLQTALAFGFTAIWVQKVDGREFMRRQLEKNARVQQMPAEQVERIIEVQSKAIKTWAYISPLVAPTLLDLIAAGFLFFVFRFFFGAELRFVHAFATVAWSFFAVGLVQTPMMLAIFTAKDDWNLDPNQVIQANATMFMNETSTPGWLWSLIGSFDLFSFWTAFLLTAGFAVATKRSFGSAAWGIGIPWALWVCLKIAGRLVFG